MLIKEEVEEFKGLMLEICNISLTDKQAEEQGSRLIQFFELLIKYSPQLASETINSNGKVVKKE